MPATMPAGTTSAEAQVPPESLRSLSLRNPLLMGPVAWTTACLAYAACYAPKANLATNPELLQEQLQRRLRSIPVPQDSQRYQQYKQYYVRQYEVHMQEYTANAAAWQRKHGHFNWQALLSGLAGGFMLTAAALTACEYHFGVISYWMELAEDGCQRAKERWRTQRAQKLEQEEHRRVERLLEEMGENASSSSQPHGVQGQGKTGNCSRTQVPEKSRKRVEEEADKKIPKQSNAGRDSACLHPEGFVPSREEAAGSASMAPGGHAFAGLVNPNISKSSPPPASVPVQTPRPASVSRAVDVPASNVRERLRRKVIERHLSSTQDVKSSTPRAAEAGDEPMEEKEKQEKLEKVEKSEKQQKGDSSPKTGKLETSEPEAEAVEVLEQAQLDVQVEVPVPRAKVCSSTDATAETTVERRSEESSNPAESGSAVLREAEELLSQLEAETAAAKEKQAESKAAGEKQAESKAAGEKQAESKAAGEKQAETEAAEEKQALPSGTALLREAEELLSQLEAEALLRQLETEEEKKAKAAGRRKAKKNRDKGKVATTSGQASDDPAADSAAADLPVEVAEPAVPEQTPMAPTEIPVELVQDEELKESKMPSSKRSKQCDSPKKPTKTTKISKKVVKSKTVTGPPSDDSIASTGEDLQSDISTAVTETAGASFKLAVDLDEMASSSSTGASELQPATSPDSADTEESPSGVRSARSSWADTFDSEDEFEVRFESVTVAGPRKRSKRTAVKEAKEVEHKRINQPLDQKTAPQPRTIPPRLPQKPPQSPPQKMPTPPVQPPTQPPPIASQQLPQKSAPQQSQKPPQQPPVRPPQQPPLTQSQREQQQKPMQSLQKASNHPAHKAPQQPPQLSRSVSSVTCTGCAEADLAGTAVLSEDLLPAGSELEQATGDKAGAITQLAKEWMEAQKQCPDMAKTVIRGERRAPLSPSEGMMAGLQILEALRSGGGQDLDPEPEAPATAQLRADAPEFVPSEWSGETEVSSPGMLPTPQWQTVFIVPMQMQPGMQYIPCNVMPQGMQMVQMVPAVVPSCQDDEVVSKWQKDGWATPDPDDMEMLLEQFGSTIAATERPIDPLLKHSAQLEAKLLEVAQAQCSS